MSQWYYAHDGKQSGPVPISELQRLAANGEFDPEKDLVWQEGLPDWKPASTIDELSSLMPGAAKSEPAPASTPSTPSAADPQPYQTPQTEPSTPAQAPVAPAGAPGQVQSGLAVASMVCGLIGLLTCFFACLSIPCAIAAIAMGHVAISRVKRDPTLFGGKGFAVTGLITGYLGLILSVVYISFFFWLSQQAPEDYPDWIPPEIKEQVQEALDEQKRLMEENQQ